MDQFVESSGNVFADLGLPNPEERLAKAQLVRLIRRRIEELGLTQVEAAKRMGLKQSTVSRVVRGMVEGLSLYRLIRCLNRLGYDVRIQVEPAVGERGEVSVASEQPGATEEYAKAA